jgi:DNA end-binding protein Ku
VPEKAETDLRRRAVWSGTVSFGLVSIPVAILPASRSRRVRMRMLTPEGKPLSRKYYCPAEDRPVDRDDIIRGYEIEKGKFITVTEDELESLQPSKSREIDLRRFVPLEQLDPKFMDRTYFLVPAGDSVKPYRLLAEAMAKKRRVGIATFVMREKEYLVAILSENGILLAETLRFADEIRPPELAGTDSDEAVDPEQVDRMAEEIRKAGADQLDPKELEDEYSQRLVDLAEQKRSSGKGVVFLQAKEEEDERDNVIDLMQILKRSMEKEAEQEGPARESGKPSLDEMNKNELYDQAKKLRIAGRSSMNRKELIRAIGSR